MTTTQAIQSVLDLTGIGSLDGASINARLTLANALSAATQEWFSLAPSLYKRTRSAYATPAPEILDCVIEPGATTTSEEIFDDTMRGSTVLIAGDATWNEVVDRSTVLYPYLGSTDSTTCTVYGDCWPFFDFAVDRVASDIECQTGDGKITLLTPRETGRRIAPGTDARFGFYGPGPFTQSVSDIRVIRDKPAAYTLEPVGDSRSSGTLDATALIRLDPIPNRGLNLMATLDILPRAYTIDHVTNTPLVMPVPDERIHSTLLPLLALRVATSMLGVVGPDKIGPIEREAAEARSRITLLPNTRHRTRGRVTIKPGY